MKDPYEVLGLSRDATAAQIKAAYHEMAKRYHPDLNRDDPNAAQRMNEINAAYERLKDLPPPAPQAQTEPPPKRRWSIFALAAAALLLATLVSCMAGKAISRPRYYYTAACSGCYAEENCYGTVWNTPTPCR